MKYTQEIKLVKETIRKTLEALHNQSKEVMIKDNKDLVTIYDMTIEKDLIDAIKSMYPQDLILSEETHQKTKLEKRCWIIDPIDGTTNFVQGLPLYCIQVALYEHEALQMSYILMPVLHKEYIAVKDMGVTLNGKPIRSHQTSELSNALISFSGLYHRVESIKHDLVIQAAKHNMKIRTLGSVGVELAFLAEGITSAFYTNVKNIWDIAPGILLCQEAGVFNSNPKYKMGQDALFLWSTKEAYQKFVNER